MPAETAPPLLGQHLIMYASTRIAARSVSQATSLAAATTSFWTQRGSRRLRGMSEADFLV